MKTQIPRRLFLKSSGISLALPMLEWMLPTRARAAADTAGAFPGAIPTAADQDAWSAHAAAVREARQSFPSGHASVSCFAAAFLVLYAEARLTLLRLRYVKVFGQVAAVVGAIYVSTSRIQEYQHRASDVLGGGVLGVAAGHRRSHAASQAATRAANSVGPLDVM